MKKACILQPGNIGDIIICLPIAKKLHDQGYHVEWPVWSNFISHFNKGNIDYVNFYQVPMGSNWYSQTLDRCEQENIELFNLTFNQPGSWNNENSKKFRQQKEMSFDVLKYHLSGVDIQEKWKLTINRNSDREQQLFDRLNLPSDYVVTHYQGSDVRKEVKLENLKGCEVVEIQPITDCVFDWLKVIEQARCLVLLDSAFANLVEQLNLPNKKFFIKRRDFVHTPKLKNDWTFID